MELRFDHRVAMVTGAGSGLGAAQARALAQRGARVVVVDYGAQSGAGSAASAEAIVEHIRLDGGEAMAFGADVSRADQVDGAVKAAVQRWGRIDILINNAGILRDSSFGKMSLEDFRRVVEVHLIGSAICSKAVWPLMREAGYGRILMTTSSVGLYGSYRQANYSAAKMGVIGLMNTLRIEGEAHGIRVNALAPAAITPMNDALMPDEMKARMPVEAITPAALFLVSEEAPTGEILSALSGGFSRVYVAETETVFLPADQWTPEGVAGFHETARKGVRARYRDSFEHVSAHVSQAAALEAGR